MKWRGYRKPKGELRTRRFISGYREGKDEGYVVLFDLDVVEGRLNPDNYSMENEEKVFAQHYRRQGEVMRGTELWCRGPAR